MKLLNKLTVMKEKDSGVGKEIDLVSSKEDVPLSIPERMLKMVRKTTGTGFIIAGVITGVISVISLLIGAVLLIPSIVNMFKQKFLGKTNLPF